MKLVQRVLSTIAIAGVLGIASIAQSVEPTQALDLRATSAPTYKKGEATVHGIDRSFGVDDNYDCVGKISKSDFGKLMAIYRKNARFLVGYEEEFVGGKPKIITETVGGVTGGRYSFIGTCSRN